MTTRQIVAPAAVSNRPRTAAAAALAASASGPSDTQVSGSAALATMIEIEPLELPQHEQAREQRTPEAPSKQRGAPRTSGSSLSREQAAEAATVVAREAVDAGRADTPTPDKPAPSANAAIAASVIRARKPRVTPTVVAAEPPQITEIQPPSRSRKQAKADQHEAAAAARAVKQVAKAAEQAAKQEARVAERAMHAEAKASKSAAKVAERAAEPDSAQRTQDARLSRRDRRIERMGRALELRSGETITLAVDGRSGPRRASLLVTRYRVAVVTRSRRMRTRWIPLEDVSDLATAWRGAPTIHADATVEHLTFSSRSKTKMAEAATVLEREVRIARSPGAQRHDASVTQEWCDRSAQTWDDSFGRIRLWIRRHPVFSVTWLFAVMMVTLLTSTHSLR